MASGYGPALTGGLAVSVLVRSGITWFALEHR